MEHKIKKAIIPIAGLATRIYPMNKVTKKAFLPIIDIDGRVKPLILKLLEELDKAEIEEVYLIIGKDEEILYNTLFNQVDDYIFNKISNEDKLYDLYIKKFSKKIKYIIQEKPLGFGHAIFLAKEYIGNDPCIILLGDTLYSSNSNLTCVEQLLEFYDKAEKNIIALQELKEEQLKNYGTVNGKWINKDKTQLILNTIVEKPSIDYARKNLLIDGKFYGNFGEFIATQSLFNELEEIVKQELKENQEYQLMDAFDKVIKKEETMGIVINGKSYDIGNTKSYIQYLKSASF